MQKFVTYKLQPVLRNDMIELEIEPYFTLAKKGFKLEAPLYEIVISILYKLKIEVKWGYTL